MFNNYNCSGTSYRKPDSVMAWASKDVSHETEVWVGSRGSHKESTQPARIQALPPPVHHPYMWLYPYSFSISVDPEHCKYIAGREIKKDGRAKGKQKRTMLTKSVPFYQKDNRVSESHPCLIFLLRTTLLNHLSL